MKSCFHKVPMLKILVVAETNLGHFLFVLGPSHDPVKGDFCYDKGRTSRFSLLVEHSS